MESNPSATERLAQMAMVFEIAGRDDDAAALRAGAAALRQQGEATMTVSLIHEGEENDGPLESTDLFLQGRGISYLLNVTTDGTVTYTCTIDGKNQHGTIRQAPPPVDPDALRRLVEQLRAAADLIRRIPQHAAITPDAWWQHSDSVHVAVSRMQSVADELSTLLSSLSRGETR